MKKLLLQAFCFFGISGIGWLIDVGIYTTLTFLNFSEFISNIISSCIAVTFVYLVSTKKLFENKSDYINLKKKYVLYVIYQIIMISFFSYVISLLSGFLSSNNIFILSKYSAFSSKIIVTPFTMIINFIFMKFLIEKIGTKKDKNYKSEI